MEGILLYLCAVPSVIFVCGSFIQSILQVSAARVSVVAVFPSIVLIPGVRVPESVVLIPGVCVSEYYVFLCARTTGMRQRVACFPDIIVRALLMCGNVLRADPMCVSMLSP